MDVGPMEAGAGEVAEQQEPVVKDIDAGEAGTFTEYITENVAYLRDLEVLFSPLNFSRAIAVKWVVLV